MITTVKNICKSNDLPGSFLIQPLKSYHSFLVQEIKNSHTSLKKCASLVVKVVTAIFAYPLLSALAAVGFLVKLTGIPALKNHNRTQESILDTLNPRKGLFNRDDFMSAHTIPEPTTEPGMKMKSIGMWYPNSILEYTIPGPVTEPRMKMSVKRFLVDVETKDAVIFQIKECVKRATTKYKKIYISLKGFEADRDQQIHVGLHVIKRNFTDNAMNLN